MKKLTDKQMFGLYKKMRKDFMNALKNYNQSFIEDDNDFFPANAPHDIMLVPVEFIPKVNKLLCILKERRFKKRLKDWKRRNR